MDTKLPDGDYELTEDAAWVKVRGFAIRIHYLVGEGVSVVIYPDGNEADDSITETWAFDSELPGAKD